MRITTLLIGIQACFTTVLLASATVAQTINLDVQQVNVSQVFVNIEKQAGVTFVYNETTIQGLGNITIKANNTPLADVLKNISDQIPLLFKQAGSVIGVSRTPIKAPSKRPLPDKVTFTTAPFLTITGKVTDEKGAPLPGVTIRVKNTGIATTSNETGEFIIRNVPDSARLTFSFVGYITKEVIVGGNTLHLVISLVYDQSVLREVVVSTGYQQIPKERATGSFTQVDHELFNRVVSTDIISRIQDVVPGLINNTGRGAAAGLIIRGQTTITSNAQPLIIVDNFPYDNDITNINPNDVESITVLKDAAAASIWGARAGNGVIVVTTKKGRFNQKPVVSFNSNITIGDKPNLFYQSAISSADFIDIEKSLFASGIYSATESSTYHYPLTPVVELLIAARDNKISATNANNQIEALKKIDVRNDYEKYLYRKSVDQQYSLNLNGGNDNQRYFISAGFDKNLQSLVANDYDRVTLNANNTYSFLDKKLQLTTGIYYTSSKTQTNNPGSPTYTAYDGTPGLALYPYARLADNQGNALPVINTYRLSYLQDAQSNGLLDWQYRPLDEINLANNTSTTTDYRLNTSLKYTILSGLNAEVLYQYGRNIIAGRNLYNKQTYFARNLINEYTQVSSTGALTLPIPLGGLLDMNDSNIISQDGRAQLSYGKDWGENNLSAIAGYEIRDQHTTGETARLYGYDPDHVTSQLVDYTTPYLLYPYGYTENIPGNNIQSDLTDRYLSYYANAAYTYQKRYILSASGRIDQSNLFGVNTNQKGVPLYSVGGAWSINHEQFYHVDILPILKLRATYGYSGNVNKTLSAYTTASYSSSDGLTHLPYATIVNPPDPELRWERVKTINFAVDFALRKNVVDGSIEYYRKNGYDVIGSIPIAPSSGITTFTGNYANTEAKGLEVTINSKNIDGVFKWYSNLLFSHATDKVTKDDDTQLFLEDYLGGGDGLEIAPRTGFPLFAIYSYKWAGLDPKTGDPQGYLNGQVSKDWEGIANDASANISHLVYNGPARPTYFGSLRNTWNYKNLSLSANLIYRFGYYFRKASVNYTDILRGYGGSGDYELRWQKPGDELLTSVPSAPSTENSFRDGFYDQSSVLVQRADNIRLQDLSFAYSVDNSLLHRLHFNTLQFYVYASNLGIVWKATKSNLDPDYAYSPYAPPRSIAFGIRGSF